MVNSTDFSQVQKKIKDVEQLPMLLSMLVYGRSGTGKTTFAGTWPKPILLLDIKDKGWDSIKSIDGIKVLPVSDWVEIEQVYWMLNKSDHPFKTVVIDTVTQLQELAKFKVLEDGNKDKTANPTRNDWGSITGLMKRWIIEYRELSLHKLFIAQDRTSSEDTEGEDQIIPEVGPAVSPSVASTLNAAVKVIGNSYIKEVDKRTRKGRLKTVMEYRMRLGPHPYYTTKIRNDKSDYTPDHITNPKFEDILDIMDGSYKAKLLKKRKAAKAKRSKNKK